RAKKRIAGERNAENALTPCRPRKIRWLPNDPPGTFCGGGPGASGGWTVPAPESACQVARWHGDSPAGGRRRKPFVGQPLHPGAGVTGPPCHRATCFHTRPGKCARPANSPRRKSPDLRDREGAARLQGSRPPPRRGFCWSRPVLGDTLAGQSLRIFSAVTEIFPKFFANLSRRCLVKRVTGVCVHF